MPNLPHLIKIVLLFLDFMRNRQGMQVLRIIPQQALQIRPAASSSTMTPKQLAGIIHA
jgi:hypothetical protein